MSGILDGGLIEEVRSNVESTKSTFVDQGDPAQSISKLYTWNYLSGDGRVDSNVDFYWTYNGKSIGDYLMKFRVRTVQNNGGLTEPCQKLAINFIFLVEEYQANGLQSLCIFETSNNEKHWVEDTTWETISEAVKDCVEPLSKEVVAEVHDWAHKMANSKLEAFTEMLKDSPPSDRNLKAILTNMTNNSQFWNTQSRNEDTYLKSLLGLCLDNYFGRLKYAQSDWTPTQDDTTDPESSTLIPDYRTATIIGSQRYFVLLLEGKVKGNAGKYQMWDDLSKLGNEMKSALDSVLKLMSSGDVCVIGILVQAID
ncbi:hypothetical protein BGZ49_005069 [Haplosporangium sp. Z 27]|nr:hypothetical protein BGZ49_005069 [Haplosporangium sp. Z 27]